MLPLIGLIGAGAGAASSAVARAIMKGKGGESRELKQLKLTKRQLIEEKKKSDELQSANVELRVSRMPSVPASARALFHRY